MKIFLVQAAFSGQAHRPPRNRAFLSENSANELAAELCNDMRGIAIHHFGMCKGLEISATAETWQKTLKEIKNGYPFVSITVTPLEAQP